MIINKRKYKQYNYIYNILSLIEISRAGTKLIHTLYEFEPNIKFNRAMNCLQCDFLEITRNQVQQKKGICLNH